MQTGNLQHQYDLWSQAIGDTIKKVEKISKKEYKKRCGRINKKPERIKEKFFKQKQILDTKKKKQRKERIKIISSLILTVIDKHNR